MIGSFDRTIHAVQMSQDLHDLLLHHENIVFRVHSIFVAQLIYCRTQKN